MTTEYNDALHEYKMNGAVVPSVTAILRAAGLYNEDYFTEESRQRGTYIHKACLFLLQGDLDEDSIPAEYRGYIEAFKRFMAEADIRVELAETPMYHKKEKWAGTPDVYGYLNNISCVLDLKTGQQQKTDGYQLAAYQILLRVNGFDTINRFGLYLRQNGKYNLMPYKDRHDKDVFYAAYTLYNVKEK